MEQKYDDTFLARWAAGELTSEELDLFEKSTEYSEYKKIIEGVNRLEAPSFDRQKVLAAIKEGTQGQPTKVRKLIPRITYAAAAAVLLLVGYFYFFDTTTYTTSNGEQITVSLPDGSKVDLNADSQIKYNSRKWENDRSIALVGEAYFDVIPGSTFTVITAEGSVTVLGTQFTVSSRPDYYDVICYEGKVRVDAAKKTGILTKNNALRIQEDSLFNYSVKDVTPGWLTGESSFNNAPIQLVVGELERQFNISVSNKEVLQKQFFTGRFTHTSLDLALKTVFDAMEIRYTFDGNKNVSIQK